MTHVSYTACVYHVCTYTLCVYGIRYMCVFIEYVQHLSRMSYVHQYDNIHTNMCAFI